LVQSKITYDGLNNFKFQITECTPITCKILDQSFDINENRSIAFLHMELDGVMSKFHVVRIDNQLTLFENDHDVVHFPIPDPQFMQNLSGDATLAPSSDSTAPMPGVVEKIFVRAGQSVEKNEPLVVMVAMKMEYVIKATRGGKIHNVLCKVGDNVAKGAHLISFEEE